MEDGCETHECIDSDQQSIETEGSRRPHQPSHSSQKEVVKVNERSAHVPKPTDNQEHRVWQNQIANKRPPQGEAGRVLIRRCLSARQFTNLQPQSVVTNAGVGFSAFRLSTVGGLQTPIMRPAEARRGGWNAGGLL